MVGISLLMCCAWVGAQETGKNELQQRAESEYAKGNPIAARALYIKAFESYVNGGNLKQGVECGVKGNKLYYEKEIIDGGHQSAHVLCMGWCTGDRKE